MKKAFALLLALSLLFSLAACGGGGTSAPASAAPAESTAPATDAPDSAPADGGKVAVVFATGGLGDKTYNDMLYAGVDAVCTDLGLTFDYSEPMDSAEYEPLLRGYADTGEYAVIISLGYSQGSSVEAVAPNYPDQNFMLIDAEVEVDNVACYAWRENELSYMVGVMAGMMTESKKMGFIGAFDIYNVNMNAAGFTAGARSVDPAIEVTVDYIGSWDDIAGCKEMAIAMNQQGADIVYAVASTGGLGVLEAGKENDFYTISWDGNLNADAPDTTIASAVRGLPVAARDAVEKALDGSFKGGTVSMGAAEDAIAIDFEGSNVPVSDEIKAAVEETKAGIADGSITVPATLEELG